MSVAEWADTYGIHHWRILLSSHRKLAWVRFEPTTTEFRSNALSYQAMSSTRTQDQLCNIYIYIRERERERERLHDPRYSYSQQYYMTRDIRTLSNITWPEISVRVSYEIPFSTTFKRYIGSAFTKEGISIKSKICSSLSPSKSSSKTAHESIPPSLHPFVLLHRFRNFRIPILNMDCNRIGILS